MIICYRDEGGYVEVSIDTDYGISFCDGYAYFTYKKPTEKGYWEWQDTKVPIENLHEIRTKD